MRFRGRLRALEDDGPGLPVSLVLRDNELTLETEGEIVGSWSLADVTATRTTSDQFAMSFAREHLMFEAEDALGFSYEALPHIDGQRSRPRMLTKLKTAFAPTAPANSPSIDLRQSAPIEVVTPEPGPFSEPPAPSEQPAPPERVAIPVQTPSTEGTCQGTRKDGRPCGSTITLPSGLCASHDPNHRTTPRAVPVADPSLAAVFRHLEKAIRDVRSGRMDPETATALAGLARAMCETIDADEMVRPPSGGLAERRTP